MPTLPTGVLSQRGPTLATGIREPFFYHGAHGGTRRKGEYEDEDEDDQLGQGFGRRGSGVAGFRVADRGRLDATAAVIRLVGGEDPAHGFQPLLVGDAFTEGIEVVLAVAVDGGLLERCHDFVAGIGIPFFFVVRRGLGACFDGGDAGTALLDGEHVEDALGGVHAQAFIGDGSGIEAYVVGGVLVGGDGFLGLEQSEFGVVFGAVFLGAVVEEGKLGVAAQPCAEGVRAWHVFEFADVLEHFAFCDAFAGVFDDLEFDFLGEVVGDVALLPGWVEGGVGGVERRRSGD